MESMIEVKNLGKKYNINHQQGRYLALRDVMAGIFKNPFKFFKDKAKQVAGIETTEEYWALKNVNFTVNKGEVIGIIGRNGAGKSTLLKILSQITPPTTGEIKIRGRVGSLLEVGTGFHPELTGRENIMLNGAILGMTRKEIARKFDQIVEFAGIDKFLDTPVKYYSSGMYVRLAFSVAAHMEPDILIIDEVLAVGDAEFQKKCLGKMNEISRTEGRTIIFVSHNMGAIRQLCEKCLMLESGEAVHFGETEEVIEKYISSSGSLGSTKWENEDEREKNNAAYIEKIEVVGEDGKPKNFFFNSEEIIVKFKVVVKESSSYLKFGFDLIKDENVIFRSQQVDSPGYSETLGPGEFNFDCKIPSNLLNVGEYSIIPIISLHNIKGLSNNYRPVASFEVKIDGRLSTFHGVLDKRNHPGSIFPMLNWNKTN